MSSNPSTAQRFVRWDIVAKVVFTACALAAVAFAAWYAAVITLPAWRSAQQERAFESAELQLLVTRVPEIERFVHMPANQ